jgi:hypothetical protein
MAQLSSDSQTLTNAATTDLQPANILLYVQVSAITQIDLLDKGTTFELENVAADATGEDGMPGEADGALDWWVYVSDGLAAPGIKWDEDDTNTNAFYYISSLTSPTVSVTVHGAAYSYTPGDWIFFKNASSTTTPYHYGPWKFTVTLSTPGATIIEPSGVTSSEEGSLTIRMLKYDGTSWSVDSVTLYFVFDATADKLYIDDDANMTETTDTAGGLTKIEDDTTADGGDAYTQGDFLVKGTEITVNGICYVLETDLTALTGTPDETVTFSIGYFSGYDQTKGSDVMEFYIAIMVPEFFPSGQQLSYDLILTGAEHANKP